MSARYGDCRGAGALALTPSGTWSLRGARGYSGSFARQLTLNVQSVRESHSLELLQALEQAATEGGIRLQAEGVLMDGASTEPIALEYDGEFMPIAISKDATFFVMI